MSIGRMVKEEGQAMANVKYASSSAPYHICVWQICPYALTILKNKNINKIY